MKINKIDTRHGTANQSTFSHGNCLPYTGFPWGMNYFCLLYTSPSPRDRSLSRMPSSA